MSGKLDITVAKHAGFCPGVRAVLIKIDRAIETSDTPVFTFGKAIHNPGVVENYKQKGVGVINSAADAPKGSTVIIRAHGLTRGNMEQLEHRGVKIIDGTCGRVKKVHDEIHRAASEKRHLVIAGYKGHAETEAHISFYPGQTTLIAKAADIESAVFPDSPVTLLAQTTFDPAEFKSISEALHKKVKDVEVIDSICPCTLDAQAEAASIAAVVDAMIVVGGRESANTTRLAEICRSRCDNVFHIESPDEIIDSDFNDFRCIGITAGASTPDGDIDAVVRKLEQL